MEQSNLLFSYAITISVYSNHALSKYITKWSDILNKPHLKFYKDLNVDEQDEYLKLLFISPLLSRKIEHCYTFEYHTNIVLEGGKPKRHLHGTIKNITKDMIIELTKIYYERYIKVKTDKAKLDCFRCVQIVDESRWDVYIHKEQLSNEFTRWFNDLENHLESDYLDDSYNFGKCICKIEFDLNKIYDNIRRLKKYFK